MSDNPRIEELRRRVQSDPASIAFAALAEEYRRAGQHEEAIATCKAGLRRHPAYLSAHVTLGRALIEVGQYEEAREELEHVLKVAPENLAAIRGLAEIHQRLGHPDSAEPAHPAQPDSRPPAPPAAAARIAPSAAPAAQPSEPAGSVPLKHDDPFDLSGPAPWEAPPAAPAPPPRPVAVEQPEPPAPLRVSAPPPEVDPALSRLEAFLAAIVRARSDLEGPTPEARS
jgi:tetratricopeptide (TPR) repeat protein